MVTLVGFHTGSEHWTYLLILNALFSVGRPTTCDFGKVSEPNARHCPTWSMPQASDGKKGFRITSGDMMGASKVGDPSRAMDGPQRDAVNTTQGKSSHYLGSSPSRYHTHELDDEDLQHEGALQVQSKTSECILVCF